MEKVFEKRYSEAEAAEILGISRMTVRRRREDGSLGYYQLGVRKRIAIGESHISEFLKKIERNGKPDNED